MEKPSEKYRLMIYFAVATLHFYRTKSDVIYLDTESFRKENPEIVKRVFEEAVNIFNYELSSAQIEKAIAAYLSQPQSVFETIAYGS